MSNESVEGVLLELGLEDWIPLPEALNDPEILEAVDSDDPTESVRASLIALVSRGRVLIYRGPWDADSARVPTDVALDLLMDAKWYTFPLDESDKERLYFVNIDNVRQ